MIGNKRYYGSAASFIILYIIGLIDPRTSLAQGSESAVGLDVGLEKPSPDISDSSSEITSDTEEVTNKDGVQSLQGEEQKTTTASVPEQADRTVDVPADEIARGEGTPPENRITEYEPPPESIPPEPIPTAMRRRIWGLQLGIGIGFGGDDLVTAYYTDGSDETLEAGTGFNGTIGTTVTPFYFDGHAIGFALDFGIKGWTIGGSDTDFQLNMTRLPLLFSGIYSYHFTDMVALLVAGGMQLEFYPNMSGSGEMDDVDIEFDTAAGGYLEAGVMYGNSYFGVDFTLRYTFMTYTSDEITDDVDGNNFGVFVRIHIGLLTTPKS